MREIASRNQQRRSNCKFGIGNPLVKVNCGTVLDQDAVADRHELHIKPLKSVLQRRQLMCATGVPSLARNDIEPSKVLVYLARLYFCPSTRCTAPLSDRYVSSRMMIDASRPVRSISVSMPMGSLPS